MEIEKFYSDRIWRPLFMVSLGTQIAREVSEYALGNLMTILYSALFGGLGALFGYVINEITRNKSVKVKIVTLISSLVAVGFVFAIITT